MSFCGARPHTVVRSYRGLLPWTALSVRQERSWLTQQLWRLAKTSWGWEEPIPKGHTLYYVIHTTFSKSRYYTTENRLVVAGGQAGEGDGREGGVCRRAAQAAPRWPEGFVFTVSPSSQWTYCFARCYRWKKLGEDLDLRIVSYSCMWIYSYLKKKKKKVYPNEKKAFLPRQLWKNGQWARPEPPAGVRRPFDAPLVMLSPICSPGF